MTTPTNPTGAITRDWVLVPRELIAEAFDGLLSLTGEATADTQNRLHQTLISAAPSLDLGGGEEKGASFGPGSHPSDQTASRSGGNAVSISSRSAASFDVLTNDEGYVAVLYSPGYGAGWLSWSSRAHPSMVMDRELATAVLHNDNKAALEIAERKWPDEYHGGIGDLRIEWMRPGSCFRIKEYDGSESIVESYEDWISVPVPALGTEARSAETEGLGLKDEEADYRTMDPPRFGRGSELETS